MKKKRVCTRVVNLSVTMGFINFPQYSSPKYRVIRRDNYSEHLSTTTVPSVIEGPPGNCIPKPTASTMVALETRPC